MKFGQLIENNMGNIFVAKLGTKYGRETRPFSKKIKIEFISVSIVLRAIKIY